MDSSEIFLASSHPQKLQVSYRSRPAHPHNELGKEHADAPSVIASHVIVTLQVMNTQGNGSKGADKSLGRTWEKAALPSFGTMAPIVNVANCLLEGWQSNRNPRGSMR